jgi:hypothetical protein
VLGLAAADIIGNPWLQRALPAADEITTLKLLAKTRAIFPVASAKVNAKRTGIC